MQAQNILYCPEFSPEDAVNLSSAGFSLWGLVLARMKPGRLKPALLFPNQILYLRQTKKRGLAREEFVLVAALIVGKHPADKHRIQETAAIGNLCQGLIALQCVGTHGVCSVQGLARGHDAIGPLRKV